MKIRAALKRYWISISIVTVAILISGSLVYTALGSGIPFGGMVLFSYPCNCSAGYLVIIGPPRGGQFVYQIGTPQFANYQLPREGVWALGLYSPGAVCMIYVGKGCSSFGSPIGTILPITGTSF